jgi:putative ABC transport system permease protein
VDLWYPLVFVNRGPGALDNRGDAFLTVLGALAPGRSDDDALRELNDRAVALYEAYPDVNWRDGIPLQLGFERLTALTTAGVRSRLYLVLGAAALLLAIACTNVIGLFVVRGTDRAMEFAVQSALGASRRQVVAQFLAESLMVVAVGAALGFVLAHGIVAAIAAFEPGSIPRMGEVSVDLRVFAVLAASTGLLGLAIGGIPAVIATSGDPARRMVGPRTASVGRRHLAVHRATVVVEGALAMILLFGSGLLLNSFVRLARIDPGLPEDGVVTVAVQMPGTERTSADRMRIYRDLLDRVRGLPTVEAAGVATFAPFPAFFKGAPIAVDPQPSGGPPEGLVAALQFVDGGFFSALELAVGKGGRVFSSRDVTNGEAVAVVNETLARRAFGTTDVVGKRVRVAGSIGGGEPNWSTIVGVIEDVHMFALDAPVEPQLYLPHSADLVGPPLVLAVRATSDPLRLVPLVRKMLQEVDPTIPLGDATTIHDRIARVHMEPRFYTLLFGSFAALALGLAGVGLYGTLAYLVRARGREFGIRQALGAKQVTLFIGILRHGIALAAVGIVLGIAGALALGRLLSGLLYEVVPNDGLTLILAASVLVLTSIAAGWIPGRRATREDPAIVLRSE